MLVLGISEAQDGGGGEGKPGREVLTVSGILIAKFAKPQRSQRRVY
jgi:hypothetical protein